MRCGYVVDIARREASRAKMVFLQVVEVTKELGIKGDFRGKGGRDRKRQITILSSEQWAEACRELGVDLPWQTRRANILVAGIRFGPKDVGKALFIGEGLILEITGETKPCERMDEAYEGLRDALEKDYRGGVTCRVLRGDTLCEGVRAMILAL